MSREELKIFAVACARVFAFAAAPVFAAGVTGFWIAPNWQAQKALLAAAAVGAGAAGARAVYGALRAGQIPFPNFGK
jgi:hypothetical protein